MLYRYELDQAEVLIDTATANLEETPLACGNVADVVNSAAGPFGRTASAIGLYRTVSRRHFLHPTEAPERYRATCNALEQLLCIYAVGIVRGDGDHINPWPDDPDGRKWNNDPASPDYGKPVEPQ